MKIFSRNGSLLFESTYDNLLEALKEGLSKGADLSGANLSRANLSGVNLYGAKGIMIEDLTIQQTRILPEGDIIGYKKCYNQKGEAVIVKLLIPSDSIRSHAFGRKCRCSYAIVLEVFGEYTSIHSTHDSTFTYEVGRRVEPTLPFSDDWKEECKSGIHFFITRIEAENY